MTFIRELKKIRAQVMQRGGEGKIHMQGGQETVRGLFDSYVTTGRNEW